MKLKNNRIFIVIGVSLGILLLGSALAIAAGTGDPGSADDPLVTRSYVDAKVGSLDQGKVDDAVKASVDKYIQWQVVNLTAGQQLEAQAGTELIVRYGQTVVIDPVGNGMPDVTAGVNITAGQVVALDHLLIVPRTDGRGVAARTKAIVMYRGEIVTK